MFNLWLVEWSSTQQILVSTRVVTATQLKYRVWTASGVKKKIVSDVLRKYDVCVWSKIIISENNTRHNSTNFEAEISCECVGSERET
jgi:hypothetical protein